MSVQSLLRSCSLATNVTFIHKHVGEVFGLHMVSHICPGLVFKVIAKHAEVVSIFILVNVLKKIFRFIYGP